MKNLFVLLTIFTIIFITSCGKDEDVDVIIPPDPNPTSSFSLPVGTVYSKCAFTFENTSSNAFTYNWEFGDGSTSTEKSPEHTYFNPGNYDVKLTASSGDKTDVATTTVQIFQHPTYEKDFGHATKSDGIINMYIESDGNIIVGGRASSIIKDDRIYFARLSEDGDVITENTYGGPEIDFLASMKPTSDGGYILGVQSRNFASVLTFAAMKVDANGSQMWYRGYVMDGAPSLENAIQASDGGYYLVGGRNIDAASRDGIVLKADATGILQWTKNFGGSQFDVFTNVINTSDGGAILYGSSDSKGAGNLDLWAVKITDNGVEQWSQHYGFSDTEIGLAIVETSDGGYMISGILWGSGAIQAIVYKIDANGQEVWNKNYGESGVDINTTIVKTSDDNYLLLGSSTSDSAGESDGHVIKIDENGNQLWSKKYGSSFDESIFTAVETDDCSYIFGGYKDLQLNTASNHYLVKTDLDGNMN